MQVVLGSRQHSVSFAPWRFPSLVPGPSPASPCYGRAAAALGYSVPSLKNHPQGDAWL